MEGGWAARAKEGTLGVYPGVVTEDVRHSRSFEDRGQVDELTDTGVLENDSFQEVQAAVHEMCDVKAFDYSPIFAQITSIDQALCEMGDALVGV